MKVDLLGDMADVLRKNKFGHRLDEFEKPSLYHSNVQEKKVNLSSVRRRFQFAKTPFSRGGKVA